ncbi:hypothetical protein [Mucilaginibacter sp.]
MSQSGFMYELRTVAKDIVEKIGYDNIYTNVNTIYPSAPQNLFLNKVEVVTNFVRQYMQKLDKPKDLVVKFDHHAKGNVYGFYINLNDKTCYIVLNPNLNSCWKRFALLKELCSVYINLYDIKGYKTNKYNNYTDSIENAFSKKGMFVSHKAFEDDDVDDETYSILLATELMIPINHRQVIKDLTAQIETGALTMSDIAKSLMMPEFILKQYIGYGLLDAEPAYESFNA